MKLRNCYVVLGIITAVTMVLICYSLVNVHQHTKKHSVLERISNHSSKYLLEKYKHDLALKISTDISAGTIASSKYGNSLDWLELPKVPPDYGDGTCGENKLRSLFLEFLTHWIRIAEMYSIPYFLMCGSLIGASRNGEVLPWDPDMDILIDGRFNEVINAISDSRNFTDYASEGYKMIIQQDFRKPYDNRYDRRRFDCTGKQVDVMDDNCGFQEPLARFMYKQYHLDIYDYHFKDGKVYDPTDDGRLHEMHVVFPHRRCMFMGVETRCPNKPEPFLAQWYGNNVMRPDRKCKDGEWIKT